MNQISVENFVGVLKNQKIRADTVWDDSLLGEGRIYVSRDGIKAMYLFENRHLPSRFVEQVARKFGINSSLFFPSDEE